MAFYLSLNRVKKGLFARDKWDITCEAAEWKMQHLLESKDNEILMDCGRKQSDV